MSELVEFYRPRRWHDPGVGVSKKSGYGGHLSFVFNVVGIYGKKNKWILTTFLLNNDIWI